MFTPFFAKKLSIIVYRQKIKNYFTAKKHCSI